MITLNEPIYSKASWYGGSKWNGRYTASGEKYNDQLFTCAASKKFKMYDHLRVTNVSNGKTVDVYVNDRGAFEKYGRDIDLSKKAFSTIANLKEGVIKVKIEIIDNADKQIN